MSTALVTDPEATEPATARVRREAGALDLLVSNAGIGGGAASDRFGAVDAERKSEVLRLNAAGQSLAHDGTELPW